MAGGQGNPPPLPFSPRGDEMGQEDFYHLNGPPRVPFSPREGRRGDATLLALTSCPAYLGGGPAGSPREAAGFNLSWSP